MVRAIYLVDVELMANAFEARVRRSEADGHEWRHEWLWHKWLGRARYSTLFDTGCFHTRAQAVANYSFSIGLYMSPVFLTQRKYTEVAQVSWITQWSFPPPSADF